MAVGNQTVTGVVHEARRLLLAGTPEEGLTLLESLAPAAEESAAEESAAEESATGVAQYASYWVVRGECLYALGEMSEARGAFKEALRRAPNSPRAEILLELSTAMFELQEAVRPAPTFSVLFGEPMKEVKHERDTLDLEKLASELVSSTPVESVEMASTEKSHPTPPLTAESGPLMDAEPSEDELGLVSETLARIMVKQGKIEQARKVYIQLSRLNPDRYDYFRDRMAELQPAPQTLSQPVAQPAAQPAAQPGERQDRRSA